MAQFRARSSGRLRGISAQQSNDSVCLTSSPSRCHCGTTRTSARRLRPVTVARSVSNCHDGVCSCQAEFIKAPRRRSTMRTETTFQQRRPISTDSPVALAELRTEFARRRVPDEPMRLPSPREIGVDPARPVSAVQKRTYRLRRWLLCSGVQPGGILRLSPAPASGLPLRLQIDSSSLRAEGRVLASPRRWPQIQTS